MNTINKHGKSHSWKCISALCTKKSISSLSRTSSKTLNPIVCSLRTQSFYCNHICLVFPILQHHKEFFCDPGLVYSASMDRDDPSPRWWWSEIPLVMIWAPTGDDLSSHWWWSELPLVMIWAPTQILSELPGTVPRAGTFLAERHPWVIFKTQKWPFRYKTSDSSSALMRARAKSRLWHNCSSGAGSAFEALTGKFCSMTLGFLKRYFTRYSFTAL